MQNRLEDRVINPLGDYTIVLFNLEVSMVIVCFIGRAILDDRGIAGESSMLCRRIQHRAMSMTSFSYRTMKLGLREFVH